MSAWRVRVFLCEPSGSVARFPIARWNRLWNGHPDESLPAFANRYACFALAYLEVDEGYFLALRRLEFSRLKLGADGRLEPEALQRLMRLSAETIGGILGFVAPGRARNVLEAGHRFARKQRDAEFCWTPSPEQKEALIDAAFGSCPPRKPPPSPRPPRFDPSIA